jgi:hypothetical protein
MWEDSFSEFRLISNPGRAVSNLGNADPAKLFISGVQPHALIGQLAPLITSVDESSAHVGKQMEVRSGTSDSRETVELCATELQPVILADQCPWLQPP